MVEMVERVFLYSIIYIFIFIYFFIYLIDILKTISTISYMKC